MDDEIQRLMEELIMRRTQEKDFKSLEDQIRCLRHRFDNLSADHQDSQQSQQYRESEREQQIEELSKEVDQAHMQQLQDQNEYNELKNDYIQLNEQLGQREGELADLRSECTK